MELLWVEQLQIEWLQTLMRTTSNGITSDFDEHNFWIKLERNNFSFNNLELKKMGALKNLE